MLQRGRPYYKLKNIACTRRGHIRMFLGVSKVYKPSGTTVNPVDMDWCHPENTRAVHMTTSPYISVNSPHLRGNTN